MSADWSLATRRPLRATWVLIGILLAVHLVTGLMWAHYEGRDVFTALLFDRGSFMRMGVGGQHRIPLRTGEYWRLCTSVLLHGDGVHLTVNVLSLYALGRLLEPTLGALRWLGWFVIGGTVASLVGWLVGVVQSDGASGGAFALLAAGVWLGVVHRSRWDVRDRRVMGPILAVFLVLNFVIGWMIPGIDAIAHTIGLVCGLALAAIDPVRGTGRVLYGIIVLFFAAMCAAGWLSLLV